MFQYKITPEEIRQNFRDTYEELGFYFMSGRVEMEIGKSYEHHGRDFTFKVLREATKEERERFYNYHKLDPRIDDNFPYRYIISID